MFSRFWRPSFRIEYGPTSHRGARMMPRSSSSIVRTYCISIPALSSRPPHVPQKVEVRRRLPDHLPRQRIRTHDANPARAERYDRRLPVLGVLRATRCFRPAVPLLRRRRPRQPRRARTPDDRRLACRSAPHPSCPRRALYRVLLAVWPPGRAALRSPQP